jgi:uncharacterized membrane protein YbhN (UPF0104 family)
MPFSSRKKWLLALGVLVVVFLVYRSRSLLHFEQFSGAKLWAAIHSANYFYLFLSVVTIYACYAVRALRWKRFQSHVGQARFWNIYSMNLAGFSALFLLGRAAEPVRPLLISRKDKIPLADTFGIYALERILDGASTAVLAAIGLLVFESSGHLMAQGTAAAFEKGAKTAGTAFAIGAIVAISGLVYLRLHGSRTANGFLVARSRMARQCGADFAWLLARSADSTDLGRCVCGGVFVGGALVPGPVLLFSDYQKFQRAIGDVDIL